VQCLRLYALLSVAGLSRPAASLTQSLACRRLLCRRFHANRAGGLPDGAAHIPHLQAPTPAAVGRAAPEERGEAAPASSPRPVPPSPECPSAPLPFRTASSARWDVGWQRRPIRQARHT